MANSATQEKNEAHILLIVHEDSVRDILARMLTESGHMVVRCAVGLDGIRKFDKSKKKFDVIMCDIALPGINGFGVAKRIRKMSKKTPIVLIKGRDQELDIARFKESGADIVISRPLSLHNTVYLVEGLVRKETG